jgi:uncharacterized Zn-binding protein involved in type VI secretion
MATLSPLPPGITRQPPSLPPPPTNPASALQQGIGQTMSTVFKPIEDVNMAIASSTNAISQFLPSFPAATMTCLAIGIPHAHSHPPSLIPPAPPVPLPVIGPILLGCAVSVLINNLPAARVGDIGFNPTCCGFFPMFEIFTGSSKVYIAGMRAARMLDITMHCWPPKEWMARGAVAALVAAAKVAMMAMLVAGVTAQVAGMVGDLWEESTEDNSAMAAAEGLAAGMAAAQLAADAAAMAAGAMMGKDPCIGSPIGAITIGHPNVLIGGFPMPSGLQIAGRILAGAKSARSKAGHGEVGPESCAI